MIKIFAMMLTLWMVLFLFLLAISKADAATFTLNWNASVSTPQAPVEGYNIYKAPSLFGDFVKIGSVDGQTTTYADTQGQPGECYRVTAFNTAGESQPTNNGCAMIVAPMPPPRLSLN